MNDDVQVRTALHALVPPFDHSAGDWADALRRGGVVSELPAPRRRRTFVAVAVAASLAVVLVAGALAQDVIRSTLDELTAWVGATPGDEAPGEEQNDFQRQNAQAFTHFPPGTKVGLLAHTKYRGETYDLLGFRDGPSLCLRLVRAGSSTTLPADCAPRRQLVDLARPAAVVNAQHPLPNQDPVATAVYGLAADDVTRVEITTAKTGRHEAKLARNAFLYVGAVVVFEGLDDRGDVATSAAVTEDDGKTTTIPVETFPTGPPPEAEALPGPATPDYTIRDSHVRWLENGEARGEVFEWPGSDPPVEGARLLRPNPDSSFEIAAGYAKAADPENGNWYCLAWLWPLAARSDNYGCQREQFSDLTIQGAAPSGGEQFMQYAGLAADGVARLELFFANGNREEVPLTDNVYAVTIPQSMATKLVAYDAEGRVVGVHVMS